MQNFQRHLMQAMQFAFAIIFLSIPLAGRPLLAGEKVQPMRLMLWEGKDKSSQSHITVYPNSTSQAVSAIICPGGGYGGLVRGAEGHRIAAWLQRFGITGIVLEYELPKGRSEVPLADAQRAIRLVRSKAATLKIDPKKIGIIGFSAGGHLASTAGTHFDAGNPKAKDPVERASCRPDFMILVYPVISMGEKTHAGSRRNLLGKKPSVKNIRRFSNELQVTKKTPPAFLAHAKDDRVVVSDNSQMFHNALKKHGIATEYLELPSGGHGLNGYRGPMWDAWQKRSIRWLRDLKILARQAD